MQEKYGISLSCSIDNLSGSNCAWFRLQFSLNTCRKRNDEWLEELELEEGEDQFPKSLAPIKASIMLLSYWLRRPGMAATEVG
ncbi:unnamed protein product, partial [Prunus brigantina]